MSTTIENVSLERIIELAEQAGYKPVPVASVMDILANSQSEVMLTRFAYLIAKELSN